MYCGCNKYIYIVILLTFAVLRQLENDHFFTAEQQDGPAVLLLPASISQWNNPDQIPSILNASAAVLRVFSYTAFLENADCCTSVNQQCRNNYLRKNLPASLNTSTEFRSGLMRLYTFSDSDLLLTNEKPADLIRA